MRATAPAVALAAALGLTALAALPRAARADGEPAPLARPDAEALDLRLRDLAREATPKTVCVFGIIGLGSGAVVDAQGTVVTNAHVAAGARYAVVLTSAGERRLYRRRGIDFEKDLAILAPDQPLAAPVPFFTLAPGRPAEGASLVGLGYPGGPRGADPNPTFTFGRAVKGHGLPAVMAVLDYSDAIRTDVPIFSGNSGGPLVDLEGRLAGINGAVDLEGAAGGLAIPASLVEDRVRTLKGGVIRLPGGRILDPEKSWLLRKIEDVLDPRVKELMEQQARGGAGPLDAVPDEIARALPAADGAPEAAAAFLKKTAGSPRNVLLGKTFERLVQRRPAALRLTGGGGTGGQGYATPLSDAEVAACASAFAPGVETLWDGTGRRFRVVGRAPEHDLLFARLEGGDAERLPAPAFADDAPVGTLVAALGPTEAPLGAGVVSAPPRPISEAGARALAASGGNDAVERLLNGVKRLAESFGAADVVEAIRQIQAAMEIRRGFSAGSAPRGYARVISHDAPCGPLAAGAPLVDLRGRIVAIHVASAHFGTSYAVPIREVRAAFAASKRAPEATPAREPARPRQPERRREREVF